MLDGIPGVWRGFDRTRVDTESTGFADLDEALLGGWPKGSLSQLMVSEAGLGFSLLFPLAARITQSGASVVLVAPPFVPYAPTLLAAGIDLRRLLWLTPPDERSALWAAEQSMRSGAVAVVLFWVPSLDLTTERRLQLAAEAGGCISILTQAHGKPTHAVAAVRLRLWPDAGALAIEVERCRGGRPGKKLRWLYPRPWAA